MFNVISQCVLDFLTNIENIVLYVLDYCPSLFTGYGASKAIFAMAIKGYNTSQNHTLQGTCISDFRKGNIIFQSALVRDMLVVGSVV